MSHGPDVIGPDYGIRLDRPRSLSQANFRRKLDSGTVRDATRLKIATVRYEGALVPEAGGVRCTGSTSMRRRSWVSRPNSSDLTSSCQ
jgi:hypothetical protein